MSNPSIKAAFETELAALAGSLPAAQTSRDAKTFKPVPGQPYQRVTLLPAKPQNPSNGRRSLTRYRGAFMVTLAYPYEEGTAAADTMATLIEQHFRYGLPVSANQVTAIISNDAEVKEGRQVGDRWEIPIAIPYFANVYN